MAMPCRASAALLLAPILLAAIALALPRFGASSYVQILVYYTAYYLTLGQAWNLMSGMTGYVSFAHGALAGIGAYATVHGAQRRLAAAFRAFLPALRPRCSLRW